MSSIQNRLDHLKFRMAARTPGPISFGIRPNDTMWVSIGDPVRGPHIQADWNLELDNAVAFKVAFENFTRVIEALEMVLQGDIPKETREHIADILDGWKPRIKENTNAGK